MKTKWLRLFGLGLAVACLGLATQSQAKKPVKPPPDPEPEPGLPLTYQRVALEVPANINWLQTGSINDSGVVAGIIVLETEPNIYKDVGFTVAPETTANGIEYRYGNAVELMHGYEDLFWFLDPIFYINNYNEVIGEYYYETSSSQPFWRSILWKSDHSATELLGGGVDGESRNHAINDAGLIVLSVNDSSSIESGSYAVVPYDGSGDGAVDTWFADENGDGVNDLLFLLDTSGLTPVAMNAGGQVLFEEGILLTPDYEVLTGGGNPWRDGNAQLHALSTGVDGVAAYDMNDLEQIVGCANGRAVMWEVEDGVETVTDLTELSKFSSSLVARGINNAGQIFGTSKEKKTTEAFLVHEGHMYNFRDLTTDGSSPGYNAQDINNNGWIISSWGNIYLPVYPAP